MMSGKVIFDTVQYCTSAPLHHAMPSHDMIAFMLLAHGCVCPRELEPKKSCFQSAREGGADKEI